MKMCLGCNEDHFRAVGENLQEVSQGDEGHKGQEIVAEWDFCVFGKGAIFFRDFDQSLHNQINRAHDLSGLVPSAVGAILNTPPNHSR